MKSEIRGIGRTLARNSAPWMIVYTILGLVLFLNLSPVEMRSEGMQGAPTAAKPGVLTQAEAEDIKIGTDCLLPQDWKYAFEVDHAQVRVVAGAPLEEMDFDKAFAAAKAGELWMLAVCK